MPKDIQMQELVVRLEPSEYRRFIEMCNKYSNRPENVIYAQILHALSVNDDIERGIDYVEADKGKEKRA